MNTRSFTLAALIGGAAMALLGNLPIVNLLNCLLCIWVWLGGALAVILYRRFEHQAPDLSAGQGASLGAIAGLIGALLGFGLFLMTSAITAPLVNSLMDALQIQGDLPFDVRDASGAFGRGMLFLVVDLVLYPGFGALAGMIAANIGRSRAASSGSA